MPASKQAYGCSKAADEIEQGEERQDCETKNSRTADLIASFSIEQPDDLDALDCDQETDGGNAQPTGAVTTATHADDIDRGHDDQQRETDRWNGDAIGGELQHRKMKEKEAEDDAEIGGEDAEYGGVRVSNEQQSAEAAGGEGSAEPTEAVEAMIGEAHDE